MTDDAKPDRAAKITAMAINDVESDPNADAGPWAMTWEATMKKADAVVAALRKEGLLNA